MLKVFCSDKEALNTILPEDKPYDVYLFGEKGLGIINYKKELSGEENKLSSIAKLSRKKNSVIICGAETDNYGIVRKSAVITDGGKLLGISDMNLNLNTSRYSGGGGHRVYQTSVGRIGLVVGDDIIDADSVKAMSICDADVIIGILSVDKDNVCSVLVRAYAYLYGVPILLIGNDFTYAGDIGGEMCFGSREKPCSAIIPTKKSYRLITSKKRGINN